MELIVPKTKEEHKNKTSLVVSVFVINVSINAKIFAERIPVYIFFNDEDEKVFVDKKKEAHKFSHIKRAIIMVAEPSMKEGRGNCKRRMKNMASCDIIVDGKNYHLKINDRKITCVGANSMSDSKRIVNIFIRMIMKFNKDHLFLRTSEDHRKERCLDFLSRKVEVDKLIKRSYEIEKEKDFFDELKDDEKCIKMCKILLYYIDEYNDFNLFYDKCKVFLDYEEGKVRSPLYKSDDSKIGKSSNESSDDDEESVSDIFSEDEDTSEMKSAEQNKLFYYPFIDIKIKKSEIYCSIFHFRLIEFFKNKYFFRFTEFALFLETIRTEQMRKKDGETEGYFCSQFFPELNSTFQVTFNSEEKIEQNLKDKSKKILKHRFSLPSTFTLKQISPSQHDESYEVYLKFINMMNLFIEKELKTTFSAFYNKSLGKYVFPPLKELKKGTKGRKKKVNSTPALTYHAVSPN